MKLKIQFSETKAEAVPVRKLNLWGPMPVIDLNPAKVRFLTCWPHDQVPVQRRQLRASV